MAIGLPPHHCRTRRNSRGQAKKGGGLSYERHTKRTKSRPRLRRRRLRPGKQEILTAVRPPRNLLRRSCFGLLYSLPHSPAWPRKALSLQANIRRISLSREWQGAYQQLGIVVSLQYCSYT